MIGEKVVGDTGKEPGGWELLRGLDKIERTLQSVSKDMLSAQVFAIEKAAIMQSVSQQGVEIVEMKATRLLDQQALQEQQKRSDDQKGRNRLFVYGLVLSPVVGVLFSLLLNSATIVPR